MPNEELRAAHPGAICRPIGDQGITKNGTPMVCRMPDTGGAHARWGRRDPLPPPKTKRRRRGPPRKGTGLRRAAYQQLPEPSSHTVPLPQKLVDQLSPREVSELRHGAKLAHDGPHAQQRVREKLTQAGLLDADGNTTERGHDALRRLPTDVHLVDRSSTIVLPPADRSADAGVDWEAYDACSTCGVAVIQPCRDLRTDGGINATPHPGRPLTDAASQRVRVLREMEEEETRRHATEDQQLRDGLTGTEVAPDEAALQRILDNPVLRDDYLRTLNRDRRRPAPEPEPEPATPEQTAPRERTIDDEIRDAYQRCAPREGDWVPLDDLRKALPPDLSRADVDEALVRLGRDPNTRLEPEMNQKTLTEADREAALNYGGQPQHAIQIQKPLDETAAAAALANPHTASNEALAMALRNPYMPGADYERLQEEHTRRAKAAAPQAAERMRAGSRADAAQELARLDDTQLRAIAEHEQLGALPNGALPRAILDTTNPDPGAPPVWSQPRLGHSPARDLARTERARAATQPAPTPQERVTRSSRKATAVNWNHYQACPDCGAGAGKPCQDLRSETPTETSQPHPGRPLTKSGAKYQALYEGVRNDNGPSLWEELAAINARNKAARDAAGPQEVRPEDALPRSPRKPAAVNWNHYEACPDCGAAAGKPCQDLRSETPTENSHPHQGRPLTKSGAKHQALYAGALNDGSTAFQQMMEAMPVQAAAEPGPAECNGTAMCPKHPLKRGPHRDDSASPEGWYQKILDGRGHEVTDGELAEALEDAIARPGVGDGTAAYVRELQQQRAVVDAEHLQTRQGAADARPAPLPPVDGHRSSAPLAENGWGYDGGMPVSYHDDGPVGTAVKSMGGDAHMDVDGEPLANVVGRIATDTVRRRQTPAEGVARLKTVRDRLPAGSRGRRCLDDAIEDMDVPAKPLPALPPQTPAPIRDLVATLNDIPLARGTTRGSSFEGEIPLLVQVAEDFAAGRTGGRQLVERVRQARNQRHESLGDSGKLHIDEAVDTAVAALQAMPRTSLYPPKQ